MQEYNSNNLKEANQCNGIHVKDTSEGYRNSIVARICHYISVLYSEFLL